MWELATAIAAVRLVTDFIKRFAPSLSARPIQLIVLALSVGSAFLVAGTTDVKAVLGAMGAVFAGAICFFEVVQRRP